MFANWKLQYQRSAVAGVSRTILACLGLLSFLAACQPYPASQTSEISTSTPTVTLTAAPLVTVTPLPSPILDPSSTPTQVPLPTEKPATATTPPTPSVTPTYAVLRGKVVIRSNCRYGPGAVYLYYVGLRPGTTMNVIGRNDLGTWVLIQGAGDNRYCWIKASLMEIDGDVMAVQPTYVPLPLSPYYRPPSGVTASREGDQITIRWNGSNLRPGDQTASPHFLVEAWLCVEGQVYFTPVGTDQNYLTLVDEDGCDQPSRGLVYIVEKHGYTRGVEVPWPDHTDR